MIKWFLLLGSINSFLAVALGAFGAHGLKHRLPAELMAVYQTAVQYHLFHALGLLLIGLMIQQAVVSPLASWAGWLIAIGILLFSGSLYVLSISGIRALGIITPLGGLAFLGGWLLLAIAVWQTH